MRCLLQIGIQAETEAVQGYSRLKGERRQKGDERVQHLIDTIRMVAIVQVVSDEASKVEEGWRRRERETQTKTWAETKVNRAES